MGVSSMSPQAFAAVMWGLPLVGLLFTFWLPAAIQLSFLVSGICSFGQATLFRQVWFREYFKMTPLPQTANGAPKPLSPYQGNLKVAANPILSQAELNSRFQRSQVSQSQTAEEIRKLSAPTGVIKKILGQVTGTTSEIQDAIKGVIEKGKDYNENRNLGIDKKEQQRYEKKRQEELRRQRWEIENQKRAERAARKHQDM